MISQTPKPKTPRRSTEGKSSKKPRVCPDECPTVLVDEHIAPITIETECEKPTEDEHAFLESIEPIDTEPEPQENSHIIEPAKVLCCCGSVISAKSMSKHEKTKKHVSFLESQETSASIVI